MRRLIYTYFLFVLTSPLFSQEGFDYQMFRLGVQYLYEDPEPTEEFHSPILGMRLTVDEFDDPTDPLYTYLGLARNTSSGPACYGTVPSFAGIEVQQTEGFTIMNIAGRGHEMLRIHNQAKIGSSWQAFGDISARVDTIREEVFLGLTDSVKYIRFYSTSDGEELAVPIRISKSYGLLTGTFFWQLESTTTPLELVGISEPAAGLQMVTLDNTLMIPHGAQLDISRIRSEITGPDGQGYFAHTQQKVTTGTFICDPIIGSREVQIRRDEFSFKIPYAPNAQAYDQAFVEGIPGRWTVNETDHDWLDAQPGELYSSDERTESLFVAGRDFGCFGTGKQAHHVIMNNDCISDAATVDAIPTGFYLANRGGPYFTADGVGSANQNNLVATATEEGICGDPFDFSNPLDTAVLGQAFSWQLFRPGVQYIYQPGEEGEDLLQHLGMKLTGVGEETVYESYRGYFSDCPQRVPSFAGVRIRQEPELTSLLFYTDSLHLRTAAQISTTWMANDTTLATVDSIVVETFLGLTDSVKYISFKQSTTGAPIGSSIRIGKQYGLLTATYFYDLPSGIPLELVGTSIENTGLQAPNFESFTAFEPGDEFHVKYIETMDSGSTVYYLHREVQYTVQERQRLGNGRVLIHLLTNELSWRVGSTMPPNSTYRERRLMTMDFDLVTMPYLNYQPGQLYEERIYGFGLVKLLPPNASDCFRESVQLQPFGTNDDGCVYEFPFSTIGNFITGLGGPYFQFVEGSHVIQNLLYFNNANGICGTPLDFNGLIDDTNDFHPDERIRLYPNPSDGRINLEVPADLGPVSLTIFSLTGQQVLNKPAAIGNRSLSVASLPTGLYTVLFQNASGAVGRRRVVRQ